MSCSIQSPMLLKTCMVCGDGDDKYKCPKCRMPYCSVTCCRNHKETCSGSSDVNISASQKTSGGGTVSVSKYMSADELTRDPLKNAMKRRKMYDDDENDEDLDEGWRITAHMMDMMQNSEWLRKELEDGGLRQLIAEIDSADAEDNQSVSNLRTNKKKPKLGAEPDLTNREVAFMKSKQTNHKFSEFIDKLLVLTGVLQKDNINTDTRYENLATHDPYSVEHLTLVPIQKKKKMFESVEELKKDLSTTSSSDDSDTESDESSDESSVLTKS